MKFSLILLTGLVTLLSTLTAAWGQDLVFLDANGSITLLDRRNSVAEPSAAPEGLVATATAQEGMPGADTFDTRFVSWIQKAEATLRQNPFLFELGPLEGLSQMLGGPWPLHFEVIRVQRVRLPRKDKGTLFAVIGRLPWRGEMVLAHEDLQAIRQVRLDHAKELERIRIKTRDRPMVRVRDRRFQNQGYHLEPASKGKGAYPDDQVNHDTNAATKQRDDKIAAILQRPQQRIPTHEVILLTRDPKVATWPVGESQSIDAYIIRAGAFLHQVPGDLSAAHVRSEFLAWPADQGPAPDLTAPPKPKPKPKSQPKLSDYGHSNRRYLTPDTLLSMLNHDHLPQQWNRNTADSVALLLDEAVRYDEIRALVDVQSFRSTGSSYRLEYEGHVKINGQPVVVALDGRVSDRSVIRMIAVTALDGQKDKRFVVTGRIARVRTLVRKEQPNVPVLSVSLRDLSVEPIRPNTKE